MQETCESLVEVITNSESTWYVSTHIDGHYVMPNGNTAPMFAVRIDYGGEPVTLARVANPFSNKIARALRWRAQIREASQGGVTIIRSSMGGMSEQVIYETGQVNELGSLPTLKESFELLAPMYDRPQERVEKLDEL